MNKYLSILLGVMITVSSSNSMTENELMIESMEEIEEYNQVPRSYAESAVHGLLTGIKSGLKAADIRRREEFIQQYYEQQIAYEEMLYRQEQERQRLLELEYYRSKTYRKPTQTEIKASNSITDNLNKY